MPIFIKIGQKVAEILHFFDFSIWRLDAILNFQIPLILATTKSVKQLQRYYDFPIFFQDGSRPPSWMCLPHFGPPKKYIWWFLLVCKI